MIISAFEKAAQVSKVKEEVQAEGKAGEKPHRQECTQDAQVKDSEKSHCWGEWMEASLESWAQRGWKGALFTVLRCTGVIQRVMRSQQEFQVGRCHGKICVLDRPL